MKLPREGPPAPIGWRAFSLLELTLVLAILAILGMIAAPRYARALSRHRVDMAVRRIKGDLALARSRAVALSADQTVVFSVDPGPSTYTIVGMIDPDRPTNVYTIDLERAPYHASITSATLGGDATVIYNGYGVPDTGGTIVLQSGGHEGQVDVPSPMSGVVVD